MQTWFDYDHDIIDAAIDQWHDRQKPCVRAGGGHFEHMFIYMIHENILYKKASTRWQDSAPPIFQGEGVVPG